MALGSDVAVGLAAISAIAAAVSARSAARGVALNHRPYVYGEPQSATGGIASVRLHNDGPGTAVEVRWRLRAPEGEPTEWSSSIRAMQPGEVLPPYGSDPMSAEVPDGIDGHQFRWFVEAEYSDIRGARWRLHNDRASLSATATPRRIRKGIIDRWRLLRAGE
jgi:hypothetical protein